MDGHKSRPFLFFFLFDVLVEVIHLIYLEGVA